jgi:O-antigen/teichoic acid export membrane protein
VRLSDQAALLTLGRFAARMATMVSSILLVRLLSKDAYGTYLQIGLVAGLASGTTLGLPQGLLYFLPGADAPGVRRVLGRTVLLVAGLATLVAAVLYALVDPIGALLRNPALSTLALPLAAFSVCIALDRLIEPALVGQGRTRESGLLSGASSALLLLAVVVPAWMGASVGIIYAFACSAYALKLLYLLKVWPRSDAGVAAGARSVASLESQLRHSIPVGLAALTGLYSRQVDGVLVSALFSPAVYAVYSRGAFELPLVDLVPFSLATAIFPTLVRLRREGSHDGVIRLWNDAIRLSSLLIFPAFAFAFAFAREIITTLFTESYAQAVDVFRVYLLALPFRLTWYGALLQAVGDTKTIFRSSLVALFTNVALSLALCLWLGPPGAAAGYVIAQVAAIGYTLAAVHRRVGVPVRALMPWGHLARVGAIALVLAAAARVAGEVVEAPLLRLSIAGAVAAIGCPIAFLLSGTFGPELVDFARRWRTAAARRSPAGEAETAAIERPGEV